MSEQAAIAPENTNENEKKKMSSKTKLIIVLVITAILAGSTILGITMIQRGRNYLTTDNARVTTSLVYVASNIPGTLERFTIAEGQRVSENEILGWVENGEAMRSPVNGLVVHTDVSQGQMVPPMQPLAVIADTSRIRIQANIEETDIQRVRLGQSVSVTVDGLGNQEFSGYVSNIGHITAAELSGQAMFFNTGGTFTRVTHLIPVEVRLIDDVDLSSFIGVNARVRISVSGSANESILIGADTANTQALNGITVSGVVDSMTSRNIYSMLGFTIDHVYAEVGDYVQEGQVLAVLDTVDLELAISQQKTAIAQARQNSEIALSDTQRMQREAQANLANNANVHVVNANAALSNAQSGLEMAQRSYNDARRDYNEGTNPQVLNAESFLRTAQIEYERIQTSHANLTALYSGGVASSEEIRQSENALTHARNQYNDARTAYNNAVEAQLRTLNQLSTALQSATTARNSAQEVVNASRTAAQQDIERLRSNVMTAEVMTNVEHMEAALEQLERHLEDATITAPISGTITEAIAREGAAGVGLMFVIEDTNDLRIMTSFREYDMAKLSPGMEVSITSYGTGDEVFTGVINRINPAAMAHTPVTQFEAEVLVTSQNTNLRIGMNTRINVELE